jgi:hypothetical protein
MVWLLTEGAKEMNMTAQALELRIASNVEHNKRGEIHFIKSKSFSESGMGRTEADAVKDFLYRNGLERRPNS